MKAKPTAKELGWNTVNLVHHNQMARHNTTARRNITAMALHSTTGGTTKKGTSKMVINDMTRRLDRSGDSDSKLYFTGCFIYGAINF
jgi:hypothetical protein